MQCARLFSGFNEIFLQLSILFLTALMPDEKMIVVRKLNIIIFYDIF